MLRAVLLTIIFITLGELSYAQDNAIYVATYVDVLPSEGGGATLLKRYRDASRKEHGNLRLDALHEKAFDTYAMAAPTRLFRERLSAMLGAPYDERLYTILN
jgi:hypothetical protein